MSDSVGGLVAKIDNGLCPCVAHNLVVAWDVRKLILCIRCSCHGLELEGLYLPVPGLQHCTFQLICL